MEVKSNSFCGSIVCISLRPNDTKFQIILILLKQTERDASAEQQQRADNILLTKVQCISYLCICKAGGFPAASNKKHSINLDSVT